MAWITADPGNELTDTVAALALDVAGAAAAATTTTTTAAQGRLAARFENHGRPDAIGFERPSWGCRLLERHLGKAAQLAAVQLVQALTAQQLDGPHADAQVLIDPLTVEGIGHAG